MNFVVSSHSRFARIFIFNRKKFVPNFAKQYNVTCYAIICATIEKTAELAYIYQKIAIQMRPRIYIDTSVIGGYFDDEFEDASKRLFTRIANRDFDVYFSEVNETELSLAPKFIRDLKKLIPKECYKYLDLDDESKKLAETYIIERVLGQASLNDA